MREDFCRNGMNELIECPVRKWVKSYNIAMEGYIIKCVVL